MKMCVKLSIKYVFTIYYASPNYVGIDFRLHILNQQPRKYCNF